MKCTLEIYGETHQSTKFTERQVSLFLAASAGATGINIKDLFEDLMGAQQIPVKGLREYNSLESAENDLAFVLKRVFPTLKRSIESIDTTDLVTIVRPMLFALVGVEDSIDRFRVKALVDQPSATQPGQSTGIESAVTRLASAKTIRETEIVADPWVGTREDSIDIVAHPEDWVYPKITKKTALSSVERNTIGYVSTTLNHTYETVDCWYAWFKAVSSAGGPELSLKDTIDLVTEKSGNPFNEQDCAEYHRMIQEYLGGGLEPELEPIAA